MLKRLAPLPFILVSLTACDQINSRLGLEDPARKEARAEAEGKAVGSGCRQSGRAIEDCYSIYNWLPKAAIYTGWREMDGYMRENNIETVAPVLPPAEPPATGKKKKKAPPPETVGEGSETKPDEKGTEHADPAAGKH